MVLTVSQLFVSVGSALLGDFFALSVLCTGSLSICGLVRRISSSPPHCVFHRCCSSAVVLLCVVPRVVVVGFGMSAAWSKLRLAAAGLCIGFLAVGAAVVVCTMVGRLGVKCIAW